MGHGWWQRVCVGSSWLLKVRDGAVSQTVEAFAGAGLEPGDGVYWDKRWPGAGMVA